MRWTLLVPSALVAFVFAFFVTGRVQHFAGRYWCERNYPTINPDFCFKPTYWETSFYAFGGALAAAMITTTVLCVAPRYKRRVGGITLCIGMIAAAALVLETGLSLSSGIPVLAITLFAGWLPIEVYRRVAKAQPHQ